MRTFLFGVVLAIAMLSWRPAHSEQQFTTENKITNLTWCFHRTRVAPIPKKMAANCQRVLVQLQDIFGDNFENALIQHSRDMKELLSAFPEDVLTGQMTYDIIYAKRDEI